MESVSVPDAAEHIMGAAANRSGCAAEHLLLGSTVVAEMRFRLAIARILVTNNVYMGYT